MKMTETAEPPVRKISSFYLVITLVIFVLSVSALFYAVDAYAKNQNVPAGYFTLIGSIGLALSAYMLLQTKKKPSQIAFKMPQVITTILCQKCGFKNIRDYQKGDYIFKEAEPCPKCNKKMMIASIYREVKEKGKKD